MPRAPFALALVTAALLPAGVRAQDSPPPVATIIQGSPSGPAVEERRAATWPVTIAAQVFIGFEAQGDRGTPLAFGVAGEIGWRARIGGFVGLLSSNGTYLLPSMTPNGVALPSLADRLSVPIAATVHPFFPVAERLGDRWIGRLLGGFDVQLGLSVETLRTSEENQTVVGFHLGFGLDVPIYGGPRQGGVALRLYGRLIAAPEVHLATAQTQQVFEGTTNGQLLFGLVWRP